jgi:hypothetical protein
MRVRRLFTLMLVFFVLSTATVVASSIWGDFEGFNKVKVVVNGETQQFSDSEVPGFIIEGKTVLPLRALAGSLQALVKWDNSNKTVTISKPNVHMFVVKDVNKDYSMTAPFGIIKKGKKVDEFTVFAQVDNLNTSISSVRVSIETPSGSNAVEPYEKTMSGQMDAFWLPVKFTDVSFDELGTYTVKFAMKLDGGSDYTVVSEKQIKTE